MRDLVCLDRVLEDIHYMILPQDFLKILWAVFAIQSQVVHRDILSGSETFCKVLLPDSTLFLSKNHSPLIPPGQNFQRPSILPAVLWLPRNRCNTLCNAF